MQAQGAAAAMSPVPCLLDQLAWSQAFCFCYFGTPVRKGALELTGNPVLMASPMLPMCLHSIPSHVDQEAGHCRPPVEQCTHRSAGASQVNGRTELAGNAPVLGRLWYIKADWARR